MRLQGLPAAEDSSSFGLPSADALLKSVMGGSSMGPGSTNSWTHTRIVSQHFRNEKFSGLLTELQGGLEKIEFA